MKIALRNNLGVVKETKVGFSWTTLFFGPLPALFRGDILWFIVQIIAAILTGGISALIFPFVYNRIYIKKLLNDGYVAHTESAKRVLIEKGYIAQ